jgi:hypothetical protein
MRTTAFYGLFLIGGLSAIGCGSSNSNRPDPSAEQRQNERIREDADDSQKSLQKEEDKRDDQPNRR